MKCRIRFKCLIFKIMRWRSQRQNHLPKVMEQQPALIKALTKSSVPEMLGRAPVGKTLMKKVLQERPIQEKPNFTLEPLACPEFLRLSYWWLQSSRWWKMSLKSWNGGAELTLTSLSLWAPVKTAFTGTRAYGGDLSGSSRYHCVPMASFQRSANSCWELSLVLPQHWSNPPNSAYFAVPALKLFL